MDRLQLLELEVHSQTDIENNQDDNHSHNLQRDISLVANLKKNSHTSQLVKNVLPMVAISDHKKNDWIRDEDSLAPIHQTKLELDGEIMQSHKLTQCEDFEYSTRKEVNISLSLKSFRQLENIVN